MALVNAYLFPHSPLLIPEIGKANNEFLRKTLTAYQLAKESFESSNIETVIIISPHNQASEDFFIISTAPEMEISFPDFGFIPPRTSIKGDIILTDQIKNKLKNEVPLKTPVENILDYGSAIPLYLLKSQEKPFKVLTISPANKFSLQDHFDFGNKLANAIKNESKKIAIIASGDLSHRLKRKSPGGYSPKGAKFDNKLIEYLSNPETAKENILNMDSKLISDANECVLKPLAILLGVLEEINWEPNILAYQTDFGVGYLSMEMIIKNQK